MTKRDDESKIKLLDLWGLRLPPLRLSCQKFSWLIGNWCEFRPSSSWVFGSWEVASSGIAEGTENADGQISKVGVSQPAGYES